ncbi:MULTISPECIES: hypothetical protein [Neptunomonas]|uniref:hypothetical protein n=1 Tax=Neptunomonas TaxID=75687 RepID=UPI0013E2C4ED|nr:MULTISPECIES: hypothetical protein [Neptunomonas]
MYSHRAILLIIMACWLFLPAIFEWWLALDHALVMTFGCWLFFIVIVVLAELRREDL